MSDKKKSNLAAFLNKNKSKKGAATDKKTEQVIKQEEDDASKPVDDAPIVKTTNNPEVLKNAESSDEEVDETDVIVKNKFGKIKEGADNANDKEKQGKVGFGFVEEEEKKEKGQAKKKTTGGDIKFGKPTFARGNRKMKFVDDNEFQGLDDLDEDNKDKKQKAATSGQSKEEEKEGDNKPRFKGKLNLTGTGGQNQESTNEGVKTNYGFAVKYKSDHKEGEQGKKEDNEERNKERGHDNNQRGGGGRGGRGGRSRGGGNWNKNQATQGFGEDDGFQVVQDDKQKRYNNRRNKKQEDSDDSNDGGFHITKGGNRGRGRGNNVFRNND